MILLRTFLIYKWITNQLVVVATYLICVKDARRVYAIRKQQYMVIKVLGIPLSIGKVVTPMLMQWTSTLNGK